MKQLVYITLSNMNKGFKPWYNENVVHVFKRTYTHIRSEEAFNSMGISAALNAQARCLGSKR